MLLLCNVTLSAANEQVSRVYVVFKTHLDVGFTDLSSVVTRRYMEEFIPKAAVSYTHLTLPTILLV